MWGLGRCALCEWLMVVRVGDFRPVVGVGSARWRCILASMLEGFSHKRGIKRKLSPW